MWLRRVLSRATLDESDISQPIPAGLLNSTEDFSAIPDMISFFYLSCELFRLLKAIWSVVNARSKQATRRHHLDRQTRSGSRQYTPTQKKHAFSEPSSIRFRSQILPVVVAWPSFGSRAFSHQIVGSMLTRAVITRILFYQKAAIISTQLAIC